MEYIKVSLSKPVPGKVAVLINGHKNGYVGQIITIEDGYAMISADVKTAKSQTIDIEDTTPSNPEEITIQC